MTIDQLDIQLTANTSKASRALTSLIKKLEQLKGSTDGLKKINIKVSNSFNKTTNSIKKTGTEAGKTANKTKKASDSFKSFTDNMARSISKTRTLVGALKSTAAVFADLWKESNDYIETMNLFNITMGSGADAAIKYAEKVQSVMGIDIGEWAKNQGTFKALTAGFGVATDKANVMSQQLTQLTYDLASFYNTSTETAFDKLSSAMAGQVKGLREFGIDTTVASLQQYALSKGINASVSAMSQGEKALLRYNLILEKAQQIGATGDMARTLTTPANALRILNSQLTVMKRELGNIVSVLVTQFIPWVQAGVQLIAEWARSIAKAFGFNAKDFDFSKNANNMSDSFGVAEENLEGVQDKAKKLKKQLMGFDELNILSNPDSSSSSDSSSNSSSVSGMDVGTYDFLGKVDTKKMDEIKEKLKNILTTVGLIGSGFLAWKFSKGLINGVKWLQSIKPKNFSWGFSILGATLFLADLNKLRKYIKDFVNNGASFQNVTGILSSFAGAIGDIMITLGSIKIGGALKVVQGIGEIVLGISDIAKNGANIDNVTTVIQGLTNVAIGISVFTGHIKTAGVITAIQGLTTIITEISKNWDAIKNGDWSGVDKATLAIGAIELIGGLATALGLLSKIKGFSGAGKKATEVATTTTEVSTSTSNLTSTLKNLVKNLGLGLIIIAEVAVAAGLIVGAIWGLGVLLEQVGIAWTPVIENGPTITTAMLIGTALLVTIGLLTGVLGSGGATMCAQLGLGTAILALLGVAAGLFIAEIWAIGWGLNQIAIAWKPVLANGETIKTAIVTGTEILVAIGVVTALLGVATVATAGALPLAIGLGTAILLKLGAAALLFIAEITAVGVGLNNINTSWKPILNKGKTIEEAIKTGTALLVAIGVVTAALGVASVASVGLLPIAVGIGTALLVDLADAVVKFIKSLTKVANSLSNDLHPALKNLNGKLPTLTTNTKTFVSYMKDFASSVVSITKSTAISGFASTVSSIVSFFTKDPMKSLSEEVKKQYDGASTLNKKLSLANPELKTATTLLTSYKGYLEKLKGLINGTNQVKLSSGIYVDMKEVGKNLVTGFVDGIKEKSSYLDTTLKSVFGKKIDLDVSFTTWVDANKKKVYKALGLDGWPRLEWKMYAEGGLPSVGEMFIAREAGPEMVGTIGNKTAVANNDQIVEGITRGVYNAMLAANGNGGKDININATFTMDGDVVGKKVIKYHNGVVMQTGASPLLV